MNEHEDCAKILMYFSENVVMNRYNGGSKILFDWLLNHTTCPYPSLEEKVELMLASGLTIKQIDYWFSNARRRNPLLKGKKFRRNKISKF
jgi:hypothetical protein